MTFWGGKFGLTEKLIAFPCQVMSQSFFCKRPERDLLACRWPSRRHLWRISDEWRRPPARLSKRRVNRAFCSTRAPRTQKPGQTSACLRGRRTATWAPRMLAGAGRRCFALSTLHGSVSQAKQKGGTTQSADATARMTMLRPPPQKKKSQPSTSRTRRVAFSTRQSNFFPEGRR